jgi:hypothetical protein
MIAAAIRQVGRDAMRFNFTANGLTPTTQAAGK